jgi:hypothetical protein
MSDEVYFEYLGLMGFFTRARMLSIRLKQSLPEQLRGKDQKAGPGRKPKRIVARGCVNVFLDGPSLPGARMNLR